MNKKSIISPKVVDILFKKIKQINEILVPSQGIPNIIRTGADPLSWKVVNSQCHAEICISTQQVGASISSHKVGKFATAIIYMMYGNATWRRGPEHCRCTNYVTRLLNNDVGEKWCDMDEQKARNHCMGAKLDEQTQKHDQEACIILWVANKHKREIQYFKQENQEFRQQWMQNQVSESTSTSSEGSIAQDCTPKT
jgi:hypothetical protein